MRYQVEKSPLKGEIAVPASKSHTLRAILFGALGKGKTVIFNALPSPDAKAMLDACGLLGAKIENFSDHIEIQGLDGKIGPVEDVIQAGNSGIVLRFMAAIGALSPYYTVITGDASIRHQRPILPLLEGLAQLGALALSTRGDGFAPILIRGPLKPGKATLLGTDSQPVSALLIAAAFLPGPTTLYVKDPGEKPWIDLTLDWFKRLAIPCKNRNYTEYELTGHAQIGGFHYAVPADLSSAAFPLAAALITQSELTLPHIDMSDVQGDKELIYALQKMGAKIEIDDQKQTLHVLRGGELQGTTVDINAFIDATPIMAVIACYAKGETRIVNAAIAREKESDRLHAVATELKKMGAQIEEVPDGLVIQGGTPLKGAQLHSYHDHRMVMALTVAAMGAAGVSTIEDVACVAKTYPTFAEDFQRIGGKIKVTS